MIVVIFIYKFLRKRIITHKGSGKGGKGKLSLADRTFVRIFAAPIVFDESVMLS